MPRAAQIWRSFAEGIEIAPIVCLVDGHGDETGERGVPVRKQRTVSPSFADPLWIPRGVRG